MQSSPRKLWGTVDEAVQQFGLKREAIKRRMIPMSYYPEPMAGHIRFRVMGPRRTTKVAWQDVLAMDQSALGTEETGRKRKSGLRSTRNATRH